MPEAAYLQRHQPPGVKPLALSGERTLPDIPEENYWFRRHLVVYEWLAARVRGLRVIDMACGEGYGSDLLARSAASVVGVEANAETYEHARSRYRRANLRFERALIESFALSADAVICLQTIEHVRDPDAVLAHFRALLERNGEGPRSGSGEGPGSKSKGGKLGTVFLSTPNVLTLAPAGAERSENPWHLREYRAGELRALCRRHFDAVSLYGVFHARKLRAHQLALTLGWERLHRPLGATDRFYRWFTPAISSADFALHPAHRAPLDRALDFVAVCQP
jgi:SAM-dependent methyltransferase